MTTQKISALRIQLIEHLFRPGHARWDMIVDLLKQANGDVSLALRLTSKEDIWEGTPGERLGCFSESSPFAEPFGRPYRIDTMGAAPRTPIVFWLGDDKWEAAPTLELTWRQVFEYVLANTREKVCGQPALL